MGRRDLWEQVDSDLYEVLQVSPDATSEEIQTAWRLKAKRSHPDRGGSIDEFQVAEVAYQVLSDPFERMRYDRARTPAARASSPYGPSMGSTRNYRYSRPSSTYTWTWPAETGRPKGPPANGAYGPNDPAPTSRRPRPPRSLWLIALAVIGIVVALILAFVLAIFTIVLVVGILATLVARLIIPGSDERPNRPSRTQYR